MYCHALPVNIPSYHLFANMELSPATHTVDGPAHEELSTGPKSQRFHGRLEACLQALNWSPPRCRYSPLADFKFSMPLNLLFGLASTVTAANMYYSYPVMNKVSASFDVTYERASLILTLLQAGYGAGILFICPLGDRWRLRPLILGLIGFTLLIWTALCLTQDFQAFCALSFLTGFTTVTPQLMLPLASALAPPAR